MTAALFLGLAVVGAIARWQAAGLNVSGWPAGTLVVNVLASFVVGALGTSSATTVTLLAVGLCGSLSTFSTFAMELHDTAQSHGPRGAVRYGLTTLVLGVFAAWLGYTLASS